MQLKTLILIFTILDNVFSFENNSLTLESENIIINFEIQTQGPKFEIEYSQFIKGKCYINGKEIYTLDHLLVKKGNSLKFTCKGNAYTLQGPIGRFCLAVSEKCEITVEYKIGLVPFNKVELTSLDQRYACFARGLTPIYSVPLLLIKCFELGPKISFN